MSKKSEFQTEEDAKKTKKLPFNNFSRCRQPHCAQKIWVNDNMDIDLEIAKHNKVVHDIPYPGWVDIVWDSWGDATRHKRTKPLRSHRNEKESHSKG